jgi:bromodomain-containing protein 8
VLTEIEEIRSGLWDERIKATLGIVSSEPAPEAPTTQEDTEVLEEEPTNEIEDVSMIDAEPPQEQDEPIIIDDSDATTDEPPVAQQVTQALEEEEVDLHLTPNSIPPSPKPTEGADTAQEPVEVTNEEPAQPVQTEAEPQSPCTEQNPEEQDAESPLGVSSTFLGLLTNPRNR